MRDFQQWHSPERFTTMRNRLQQLNGWSRKVATMAARYYAGLDCYDTLRSIVGDQDARIVVRLR